MQKAVLRNAVKHLVFFQVFQICAFLKYQAVLGVVVCELELFPMFIWLVVEVYMILPKLDFVMLGSDCKMFTH